MVLLGVITILNLNGLLDMMFDVGNILSPLILLFSIVIITVVPRKVKRRTRGILSYYYYFMAFYIVYGALSGVLNGIDTEEVYILIRSHIASLILVTAATFGFFYYAKEINYTTPLNYVFVLALLSLGSIYYGIFDPSIYTYAHYGELHQSRFSGFFANPNEAGMAACAAAVFCLYYLSKGSRPIVHFGLLVLSGIGVFITFSRAAILTYTFVVFVYLLSLLISKENKRLGYIAVVIGGLLASTAGGYILDKNNWDNIQQRRIHSLVEIAGSGNVSEKQNSRMYLLRIGGSMIEESPILGHGLGSLQRMQDGNGLGVHNTFLAIQGEVGIFGSLLFIMFLVQVLRKTFELKDTKLRRFILFYLLVFVSMMFFEHSGLTDRNHNYYLGVVLAIISIGMNPVRTEN